MEQQAPQPDLADLLRRGDPAAGQRRSSSPAAATGNARLALTEAACRLVVRVRLRPWRGPAPLSSSSSDEDSRTNKISEDRLAALGLASCPAEMRGRTASRAGQERGSQCARHGSSVPTGTWV